MKKSATPRKPLAAGMAKVLKRLHYPLDVMLLCVRWYVAYSHSFRDLEEVMAERAIGVDHSTVHRWVISKHSAISSGFLFFGVRAYVSTIRKRTRAHYFSRHFGGPHTANL